MMLADIGSVLASTARLGTPLVLAGLGGLFSERAGVVALGLEGMMLGGAFAAGTVAALTGSPWVALAAAVGTGLALALVHGHVSITLKGEQVVSGMALNILVSGLCPTLGVAWFGHGGDTPALARAARFMPVAGGLSGLVLATALIVPAAWWLVQESRFGLRLRAVGENPEAVESAGLSVARLRYAALALAGSLTGMAGAYIAIADGAGFSRDMTAGRGYLALAALIFGRWRPLPTFGACLFFAFADALQLRLQGSVLPLIGTPPVELVEVLPYLLTLAALASVKGTGLAPAALGRPFRHERAE